MYYMYPWLSEKGSFWGDYFHECACMSWSADRIPGLHCKSLQSKCNSFVLENCTVTGNWSWFVLEALQSWLSMDRGCSIPTNLNNWSPLFLLIGNLINKLRLHQFFGTNTTETNKLLMMQTKLIDKITNEQKDRAEEGQNHVQLKVL